MSRIVIVILIYHRHKPIDLLWPASYSSLTWAEFATLCVGSYFVCHVLSLSQMVLFCAYPILLYTQIWSHMGTSIYVTSFLFYDVISFCIHFRNPHERVSVRKLPFSLRAMLCYFSLGTTSCRNYQRAVRISAVYVDCRVAYSPL
jgi:hypothetical protein